MTFLWGLVPTKAPSVGTGPHTDAETWGLWGHRPTLQQKSSPPNLMFMPYDVTEQAHVNGSKYEAKAFGV